MPDPFPSIAALNRAVLRVSRKRVPTGVGVPSDPPAAGTLPLYLDETHALYVWDGSVWHGSYLVGGPPDN